MKRRVLTSLCVVIAMATPVIAQQAGTNVNVLPVVLPIDVNPDDGEPDDPDWYLKGDGYLQRQVEPSIAASTRNPDHLLAFFNDYRAVDIADDIGLGETESAATVYNKLRTMMAFVPLWSGLPEIPVPLQVRATSEAWVGMSRSYDGGLTWSGGFLPGGPFDFSIASLNSPVHGLEAATDPVVAAGPCGSFYVVFVAFTRGDQSMIAVARYEDLNNEPGGDTIVYQGTTVLEVGNNAEYGYFLDKPDLDVDVFRGGGGQCDHRVYVSYSTFNGLTKDLKFQSKINFAMSEDGGQTFSKQTIQQQFTQNQGSAIAIDPRPGTPPTGGGAVFVFWRHFFNPDTIVMTKTLDYGKKWTKPKAIIGPTPMAPFDQPTISTTAAVSNGWTGGVNPGFPETGFRSNGFPTATVAVNEVNGQDQPTVFVAWQERVDIDPDSSTMGLPLPFEVDPITDEFNGSPRIVLMRSGDGGATWRDWEGIAGRRKAVDFFPRDVVGEASTPAPGSGFLPQERPSGPQVMPKLSFAGGRLMLAYYESRGRIDNYGTEYEEILTSQFEPDADIDSETGFITGYDRLLDVRAALLDPATGSRISSVQVSRYPLSAGADLYEETLADVAPVNPPCAPDHTDRYPGETLNPCVRQVNRANAPQSAAGTSPFIGDYTGMEPFVQFVTDPDGNWRWATKPGDVPTRGFHAVWADNRHLVPPQNPFPGTPWIEWQHYPDYDEPGSGALSCDNPGSRNTDVLTSRIDAELVISSPTTFKQIGADGASFPFTVSNQTDKPRTYQLTINPVVGNASFLSRATVTQIDVDLYPFSSTAQVVYVPLQTVDPITVQVEEIGTCDSEGCQSGSITFNAHETMSSDQTVSSEFFKPGIEPDAFVINYSLDNAFVINPGAENAFVINPSVDNAFVINPTAENAFVINAFVINAFVINAFVINPAPEGTKAVGDAYYPIYRVIDTTWTVTPGESTDATSFLPIINIDNAEQLIDNYVFQLIVHKGSLYGTLDGCDPANVNQPQVLSTFAQGPATATADNAFVINPTPQNAFVINRQEFPSNAFVINSTFTVAPTDDPNLTGTKNGVASNDDTLKAPRAPETVNVTLRAYQVKPTDDMEDDGDAFYNPFPEGHPANTTGEPGDPAALTVAAHNCDPTDPTETCFAFNAPDLLPLSVNQTEVEVRAGTKLTFPDGGWVLENQGNTAANAENRVLRHGFFLSKSPVVELDRDDQPIGDNVERLGFVNSAFSTLAPGETETFALADAQDLQIPADWPVDGSQDYIVVYVDDFREVSEVYENNNTFALEITVLEANLPPVAYDAFFWTDEDVAFSGSLAESATDPNGDSLTFTLVSPPSVGDLAFDGSDGSFTYTPPPDFNGDVTFSFFVTDDLGLSSEVATATITVDPVNDSPVAVDDVAEVDDNSGPNEIDVLGNDTDVDGDVLVVSAVGNASNGTTAIGGAGAFVTYAPDPGFSGDDSFTYQVMDGSGATATATVFVTVIDTVADWGFVGLLLPWTPSYVANAGSAIPLKWSYTDPETGEKVYSAMEEPQIKIKGPWVCVGGAEDGALEFVNDPGSSDLRYVTGDWQFNWDTVGLGVGCYNIRIFHPYTGQLNGPFQVELK